MLEINPFVRAATRTLCRVLWPACSAALVLLVKLAPAAASVPPGAVDAARLRAADSEPQNWFTGGRDQDGTYYSPLKALDAGNVKNLGFAWSYDLGSPMRGQEATPIVVDGVMYTSGTWGYVYAVDAASGRELWRYDPKANFFAARNPCCDLVNRGVAVWKGKVYVASVDGRLHALDAATGRKIWQVDTISDHKLPYSSTGAPQIAGDVVVIGNSGSDMGRGGVRGYVSAYDLDSGAFKWRFYTVPPAPGQPLENPELEAAAKTWDPHRAAAISGRRHGLGRVRLRSRAETGVLRHRQCRALRSAAARPRKTRQPVHGLDHRSARRHRQARLVLPDDAARSLGLRLGAKADFCGPRCRRRRASRRHAGLEERIFLYSGPRHREIALRERLYVHQLGLGRRHENRAPDPDPAIRLVRFAQERVPVLGRRTHLESHVLQRADPPRVHSGARRPERVGRHAAQRR